VPLVYLDVHIHNVAHRLQILISNQQYVFLNGEADRSSMSIAELVRRALDTVYGPRGERDVIELMHTLGRRPGRRIP
jgi:hypothetical protein